MSDYVTIEEAAKRLDCSRQNIYQLIKSHNIRTVAKFVMEEHTIKRRRKVRHVNLDELNAIFENGEEK